VSRLSKSLPILGFLAILALNAVPFPGGGLLFGFFPEGFRGHRGWPFIAMACANDEGARLVEASVLQGNTGLIRNAFSGPFPHFAWNSTFLLANGAVLAGVTVLLVLGSHHLRKTTRKTDGNSGQQRHNRGPPRTK
jgi:hypothetical protein